MRALLLAAVLLAGCDALVFECGDDSNCTRDGATGGRCLASPGGPRYCAFGDGTCAGGLRWDRTAGAGLGEQCVGGGGAGDMGMTSGDMPAPTPLTFSAANSGVSWDLYDVSGWPATGEVWIAGAGGILRSTGGGFTSVGPTGDAASISPIGIKVVGPGQAYVACDYGDLLYTKDGGQSWSFLNHAAGGETLMTVSATSPTDVWVVGTTDTVLHSTDGATFNLLHTGGGRRNMTVWAASATEAFVGDNFGTVYHTRDGGGTWATESTGTNLAFFKIYGLSPTEVYGVGEQAFIARYDGTAWSLVKQPEPDPGATGFPILVGTWASPGGERFAVGANASITGTLYRSTDGLAWTGEKPPTAQLNKMWGNGPRDVWIVGVSGTVLHGK